jgi:purine-binding chemotaxis protein CheW
MAVTAITEIDQYLTFRLEREMYGVQVSKVKEVLEYIDITRVPRMPEYMRGVINLRGSVVPVIDMRLKFGLEAIEPTVDTCIIVIEVDTDGETITVGALADSVSEVIEIQPSEIEPAPKIGSTLDTTFIKGMGKHRDEFIIILDIDKIFTSQEISAVTGGAQAATGKSKESPRQTTDGE